MSDSIFELCATIIFSAIFLHILLAGRREDLKAQPGLKYLLAGFGLLAFGMAVSVTDNFPALNKFFIIGSNPVQEFIEDVVGFVGGSLFLAIGMKKWLPLGESLRQTEKRLRRINAELETEISERKNTQEALRMFRTLIDRSSDALFVIDAKYGGFVDVNLKACESLGYEWHELLRMQVTDIEETIPDQQQWDTHQNEVKQSEELILEGLHKRKDGTVFPVEISVKHTNINDRDMIIAIARDITERKIQEAEKEKILADLQHAVENVKILSGFLPICSYCKNIRDDKGLWSQIENYIKDHSEMDFTHSICPECAKKEYPDFAKDR